MYGRQLEMDTFFSNEFTLVLPVWNRNLLNLKRRTCVKYESVQKDLMGNMFLSINRFSGLRKTKKKIYSLNRMNIICNYSKLQKPQGKTIKLKENDVHTRK